MSFETSYCSTQNTGSTDVFNWTWQSNGKCTDHCNGLGTFAFAVIKYTDCWCSNFIPSIQEDTSGCQVDCPGFPAEKCGDRDNNLFIYIKMSGSPSGTQGGSQPTSADVSSAAPRPSSTEQPSSSEAPTSTPRSSTLRTVPASSSIQAPMTVPTVFTESGVIVTRTVVYTPTPAPARSDGNNGSSSNTGAIVGGVVGGVLGLLAIVGGILFMLWRRRKQQREQQNGQDSSGITRNTSTMSKAGLLGGRTTEKDAQYLPPINTTMGSQRSRHDDSSISPVTASDRRYSQPVLVDSRLNPRAVLTFHGSNASRDSLTSIDDSRDYGRQLNVVNPDPTHRD